MSRFPFALVLLGFCAVWLASTDVGRVSAEPVSDAVNAALAYQAKAKEVVAKVEYSSEGTPSDRKLLQALDRRIVDLFTALKEAIRLDDEAEFEDALKKLLSLGESLDSVLLLLGFDDDGDPSTTNLLEAAILFDKPRFVERLIEEGADPNVESSIGPVLLLAVSEGNEEIVRILVDAGADVDEGDEILTPLAIAAIDGRSDIIEILLEAGASTLLPDGLITAEDLVCSCEDSDEPSEICDFDACEDREAILELFESEGEDDK